VINIASYIDHTILKPTTTHLEITRICEEARRYSFAAVCVPPPLVRQARQILSGSRNGDGVNSPEEGGNDAGKSGSNAPGADLVATTPVKVATVIGFPFGYSIRKAKLEEVEQAIADGADELDIVINLVALKNGYWDYLEKEMNSLADCIHAHGRIVKVIIESGILQDEEIIRCCALYSKVGVDYLKTSTGYAEKGATIGAVQLMRQHLPASILIKASGGIREYAFARQLIEAGAGRLGCSASVAIVKGESSGEGPIAGIKKTARNEDNDYEIGGEG
jgi:deoxyribose-phosphate aldolase